LRYLGNGPSAPRANGERDAVGPALAVAGRLRGSLGPAPRASGQGRLIVDLLQHLAGQNAGTGSSRPGSAARSRAAAAGGAPASASASRPAPTIGSQSTMIALALGA
jgi:hypothetical protein